LNRTRRNGSFVFLSRRLESVGLLQNRSLTPLVRRHGGGPTRVGTGTATRAFRAGASASSFSFRPAVDQDGRECSSRLMSRHCIRLHLGRSCVGALEVLGGNQGDGQCWPLSGWPRDCVGFEAFAHEGLRGRGRQRVALRLLVGQDGAGAVGPDCWAGYTTSPTSGAPACWAPQELYALIVNREKAGSISRFRFRVACTSSRGWSQVGPVSWGRLVLLSFCRQVAVVAMPVLEAGAARSFSWRR
jgi:hypothetical protein